MSEKEIKMTVSGLIALILAITYLAAPALFNVLLFIIVAVALLFPFYLLIRGQWYLGHKRNGHSNGKGKEADK